MKEYTSDQPNNAAIQHWERFSGETMTHWPGQLLFGGSELLGYTIGRFMKADTPVPADMDYIDIAEMPIAQGWKKVEPCDDIGMPDEGTMFTAIENTEDFKAASYLFAADIFPFTDKNGELIRGTFMACVLLSEQEKAERANVKKAAEESKKAKPILIKALNNMVPRGKPVEIGLAAFENNNGINYTNELLEISKNANIVTSQNFSAPVKIELRVKVDGCYFLIKYGQGHILIDAANPNGILFVKDIISDKNYSIDNFGNFPVGEFVDLEWVIDTDFMAIKINGEVWHIGNNHQYINELKTNPEYNSSSPITIFPEAATVTIESLRVTEI